MKIAGRLTTRSGALAPLVALLVCSAPAVALAQPTPKPDEPKTEPEKGEEPGSPEPPPLPPPEPGGWGVGGKEPEGKYTPHGKTGKLREKEEEEDEAKAPEGPEELTPPGYIYFDAVVGVGDERVVVQPSGPTSLFPTGSFIIATGYRFAKKWGVGVRFGIGSAKVDGPDHPLTPTGRDHDAYKRIATGGLELSFNPYFTLTPTLHLPVGLALTMPTQGGDMNADVDNLADRGTAIVNQAQAEVRGWEDRALFMPKRFGVTPSVGIRYDTADLEVGADMKIEIIPKVSGNDPSAGAAASQLPAVEVRGVAANWVLGGSFYYKFFGGYLAPGARVWIAAGTMPEASPSQKYDGAEFVLEPGVKTTVPFTDDKGTGFNAQIGWVLPFGGRDGAQATGGANSAWAWGFRIRTGMFF